MTPARSVCAVTVTYADRAGLCEQVVRSALAGGAKHVVVVDNGSAEPSAQALARLARELAPDVSILVHPENLGSAAGFAAGLAAGLAVDGTDQVWLLDDDNLPADDALEALLAAQSDLRDCGEAGAVPVMASRPDRPEQQALLAGMSADDVFPPVAAFMSFDAWRWLRRRRGALVAGPPPTAPIRVPYGAYGGLLLPSAIAAEVGPPDHRFYLYEDDTEFTHRLADRAAGLHLVPASRLADLDASWYETAPGRGGWSKLLLAPSERRVYFTVRNRVFFESRRRGRPGARARLNRLLFLAGLTVTAMRLRRRKRLRLILRAVRNGQHGRLGPPTDRPYPRPTAMSGPQTMTQAIEDPPRDEPVDGRRYVRAVARRWPLILLLVLIGVGGALAYSLTASKTYEASATLTYNPQTAATVGLPVPDPQATDRTLLSQQEVATSDSVLLEAREELGVGPSVQRLRDAVTATAQTQSNVLVVTASRGSAAGASDLANAVAEAFISVRTRVERANIARAREALLDGSTPAGRSSSPAATPTPAGSGQPRGVQSQLAALDASRAVAGTDFTVAEVARRPTAPASPRVVLNLVAALVSTLFLGVLLALAANSLSARPD